MNHLKHYTIFFFTFCFIYSCGEQFSFFREMDVAESEDQYSNIIEQENQATEDILDPERVVVFKFSSDFIEGFDISKDIVDFQIMNDGQNNNMVPSDSEGAIYRCFIGKIPISEVASCSSDNNVVTQIKHKLKRGKYKVVIHVNFGESPAHYMGTTAFEVKDRDLDEVKITLARQFEEEIDIYYRDEVFYNVNFYIKPVEKYTRLSTSLQLMNYNNSTNGVNIGLKLIDATSITNVSLEKFWFRHTTCNNYELAEWNGVTSIQDVEFKLHEESMIFSFASNLNTTTPNNTPDDCEIAGVIAFVIEDSTSKTKYFGLQVVQLSISNVQIPVILE